MVTLKASTSDFMSDEKLQLITGQIFIGHAILIAHQLGLFKLICKAPLRIHQIAWLLSFNKIGRKHG